MTEALGRVFSVGPANVSQFLAEHDFISQTIVQEYQDQGREKKREIHFAFSVGRLDESFREASVLFREFLQLSPDLLKRVLELDQAGLSRFVREVLALEVSSEKSTKAIRYDVYWDGAEAKQRYIKVMFSDDTNVDGCTIQFCMPQRKELPYFVVQISEPTYRPSITFSHRDRADFDYFPFFANKVITTASPRGRGRQIQITVEDNTWVFPRAGVLFAWKAR
jgi:hypothetical protein